MSTTTKAPSAAPRITIDTCTVGETDLYEVWNGEDAYLYLYDYYLVARPSAKGDRATPADPKVEYHHYKRFRSLEEAEALKARVLASGSIDKSHWHEVQRMTPEERFAELATWERKHDELHGHW